MNKVKQWAEDLKQEIAHNIVIKCEENGAFKATLSTELDCLRGTSIGVDNQTKQIILSGNLDNYISGVIEKTSNTVDDRLWAKYKSQILAIVSFISQAKGKLGASAVWSLVKGFLPK